MSAEVGFTPAKAFRIGCEYIGERELKTVKVKRTAKGWKFMVFVAHRYPGDLGWQVATVTNYVARALGLRLTDGPLHFTTTVNPDCDLDDYINKAWRQLVKEGGPK